MAIWATRALGAARARGAASLGLGPAAAAAAAARRSLSSVGVVVPANLSLADAAAVLAPPRTASVAAVSELDYLFPPLDVPKSIKVGAFAAPGTVSASVGELPLERQIFGAALRKDIIHEVVRYQRHKARQPKKTKRIGEIAGSTKKPRPQKGTGTGQVGNRRNSAWKGGQKAHGPVLRDYSIGLNRKMRAMGMMVALSAKLREGNLHVFDALSFGSTKTKELNALLIQHGISDPAKSLSSLVIDTDFDDKFLLACRNLALVTPLPQTGANVYDIIKRDKLVISASAFLALQERILDQYNYQGKRRLFLVQKTLLSVDQSEV